MANLPTGPDEFHGGDGLPDWMQFAITVSVFGLINSLIPVPVTLGIKQRQIHHH